MDANNKILKFENVQLNIEKLSFIIGKIEVFLKDLNNIPSLPAFRNEFLQHQTALGIHSVLAWDGDIIPVENIKQILSGKPLSQGKKFQEDEVQELSKISKELFNEIIIENKRPEITPEYIKKLHHVSSDNIVDRSDVELDEWLKEFCLYLSGLDGLFNVQFHNWGVDEKTASIVNAIIAHAYFIWMQPFETSNYKTAHLLESSILLKGGMPYLALNVLPIFYYETKAEHTKQIEFLKDGEDLTSFLEYALLGICDGIESIILAKLSQLFILAWQQHIQIQLSLDETAGSKVTQRRTELMHAIPLLNDNGLTFEQILILTPSIAKAYAKGAKTARRDLAALTEFGLLVKRKRKYCPNVIAVMGEVAGNSALLQIEIIAKKETGYSHHVKPVITSIELKAELRQMLGKLQAGE